MPSRGSAIAADEMVGPVPAPATPRLKFLVPYATKTPPTTNEPGLGTAPDRQISLCGAACSGPYPRTSV